MGQDAQKTRRVKVLDHFKDSFNYSHVKFGILRCTHQRVLSISITLDFPLQQHMVILPKLPFCNRCSIL